VLEVNEERPGLGVDQGVVGGSKVIKVTKEGLGQGEEDGKALGSH